MYHRANGLGMCVRAAVKKEDVVMDRDNFEGPYQEWIQDHYRRRSGERLRQLEDAVKRGVEVVFLRHIWWPLFHNFNNLHPQYEIKDFRDGYRYIDFAYIPSTYRLAIEIDGLGPHWKNITQWQFADQWDRQNDLVLDGWGILRFTVKEIPERERHYQRVVQQFVGKSEFQAREVEKTSAEERDVLRWIVRQGDPVRPKEVAEYLHAGPRYACKVLKHLAELGWLQAASGDKRIASYKLHPSRRHVRL